MNRFYSSLLLLIVISFSLKAQKENPPKFGKVSIEELSKTYNDVDSSASAIILYEKGGKAIKNVITYNYYTRIKILKDEGLKYSKIEIPYVIYTDRDKLSVNVSARSYFLENGQIIENKLDEDNVSNILFSLYNGLIKFNIPKPKVGSIIEYKISVSSYYDFIIGDGWQFQHDIPTLHSELVEKYPAYIKFTPVYIGPPDKLFTNKLETESSRKLTLQHGPQLGFTDSEFSYWMTDIPALKKENYSNNNKYAYRINFLYSGYYPQEIVGDFYKDYKFTDGLFKPHYNSWENICSSSYKSDASVGMINSKEFKREYYKIAIKSDSVFDKIKSVYTYIGKNFKLEKGHSISKSRSASNITKTKRGKASELNLLLISLLQQAGVKAFAAIISPNPSPPLDPLIPSISEYPKIICTVKLPDGSNCFVDMDGYPDVPTILPLNDLNGDAFVIYEENSFEWVPLKSFENSVNWSKVKLTFINNLLHSEIEMDHKGYTAKAHSELLRADKNNYLITTYGSMISNNTEPVLNVNALPTIENCNFKSNVTLLSKEYINRINDSIIINPMLSFGLKSNPFTDTIRVYPVDFIYPFDEIYQLSFEIPKGYEVIKLPAPAKLKNHDNTLKFLYAWENKGDKLNLVYKLNVKKPVFELIEYSDLREFYSLVAQKSNEKLILVKSAN